MAKKLPKIAQKIAPASVLPRKFPARTGVISAKKMNAYLDSLSKQRARHDHLVARNAEDRLLQQFANAHIRAQTMPNPRLVQTYFPGLADLPLPRP